MLLIESVDTVSAYFFGFQFPYWKENAIGLNWLMFLLCNEKVTAGNIKISEDSYAMERLKKFLCKYYLSSFAMMKGIFIC